MQTLAQAKQNFVYQVERIETEEKTKRHFAKYRDRCRK